MISLNDNYSPPSLMPSRFLKGLFVLGIVLCSCLYGTAQAYTPMLLDSTIRAHIESDVVKFPGIYRKYFSHIIEGDTLIDQKQYKLVYEYFGCRYDHAGDPVIIEDDCHLVGAVREENRVVYFYRFSTVAHLTQLSRGLLELDTEQEHVLFDFNVEIGDTLNLSSDVRISKVEEQEEDGTIFHIMVSSKFRHLNIKWIEGHGSDHGLFGSYIDPWNQNNRGNFIDGLYYRGEILRGHFTDNCNVIHAPSCGTVTNTHGHQLIDFSVWPNPILDKINLRSNQTIRSVQVIDIFGRTRSVYMDPGQSIQLNSDLEAGQYILLVEFENGLSASERIVKYD